MSHYSALYTKVMKQRRAITVKLGGLRRELFLSLRCKTYIEDRTGKSRE
jgi:hypothetical protein